MKFSLLAAPNVVKMTTFNATSDEIIHQNYNISISMELILINVCYAHSRLYVVRFLFINQESTGSLVCAYKI